MRFHIDHLGKIRQASIELGDLTILCGQNNAGKSYLSYSIFSFFETLAGNVRFALDRATISELVSTGSCTLDFNVLWESFNHQIAEILEAYSQCIPRFLALRHQAGDTDTSFRISDFDSWRDHFLESSFDNQDSPILIGKDIHLFFQKTNHSSLIHCTLEASISSALTEDKVSDAFEKHLSSYVVLKMLPLAFGITGERSGISIFCDFLNDIARNPEKDGNESYSTTEETTGRKINIRFEYALPLRDEVDFLLNIKHIQRTESRLVMEHPRILNMFARLAGGNYSCDGHHAIHFMDEKSSKYLLIREASSSVKSLTDLYFYIRYLAQPGHLLMIDEPELNLHPSNQRLMARLLAMLVNAGVKVFVTTHSDYIIREFNTLIMLHAPHDKRLQTLAEELGYGKSQDDCLLDHSAIRCYVLKDGMADPMKVSDKYGIKVSSFDDTIYEMNALQHRILYGEDES
ncbi:MAG: AAA family ATPase [Oligosphaeraceae bacterium]